MIEDFSLISVTLMYATIGALIRALFGLYKAYNSTLNIRMFSFNWRRVILEVCVSIILGTFGVVIISEAGGMGLSLGTRALALIGGLFGPDIMTFITKKVGITKAFDIRFTDEQVLLADLNPRQINAMRYLRDNGRITNSIYQKINQTSAVTAKRDLTQLALKGKIRKAGRGKSTYYVSV
jgi:hypothetical protein